MAEHTLDPTPETVHGQFSSRLEPCLTVQAGDIIHVRTVDVMWGTEQHRAPGTPRQRLERGDSPRHDGPALCGPVAVQNAGPGDVLVVEFLEIIPATWGWSFAGDSLFNAELNEAVGVNEDYLLRWSIDRGEGVARSEQGHEVPIHPFLGTVGCAPAGEGWHSGWHPRRTGGNLDCPLLGAGATLYVPVEVPGALLSIGDGHAAQGDGELAGSAIECPMERVSVRCRLLRGPRLEAPQATTPEGWVTLGVGAALDEAAHMATRGMLDWLSAERGMTRPEALTLLSVAGSLRVTQLVNEILGVHLVFDPDSV